MSELPNIVLLHGAWAAGSCWSDAERQFAQRIGATTIEVAGNHVAMAAHPDEGAKPVRPRPARMSRLSARAQ
jgi:hypothetical protein